MKALLILCFALKAFVGSAQVDTTAPLFRRYPTVPPFQLVLTDSVTKYAKSDLPKGKPVVLMLFSPDCDHCQHEAEEIAARRDELKGIQFLFVTSYPLYRAKAFAEQYGLAGMKNAVVAKDPYHFLTPFYDLRSFPFLALYDKKGRLIEAREGSLPVDKLMEKFR